MWKKIVIEPRAALLVLGDTHQRGFFSFLVGECHKELFLLAEQKSSFANLF
jgi:hypothetical protein